MSKFVGVSWCRPRSQKSFQELPNPSTHTANFLPTKLPRASLLDGASGQISPADQRSRRKPAAALYCSVSRSRRTLPEESMPHRLGAPNSDAQPLIPMLAAPTPFTTAPRPHTPFCGSFSCVMILLRSVASLGTVSAPTFRFHKSVFLKK